MKILIVLFVLATSFDSPAQGKSSRQLARKLYISLAGVTPTSAELDTLEAKITARQYTEAARDIIDQRAGIKNNGSFYGSTVKDMVTPWTNKQKTTLAPLNDMSATIIGWVRDEKKFNEILYRDTVYKALGLTFSQLEIKTRAVGNGLTICSAYIADPSPFRITHPDTATPNETDRTKWKCRPTKLTSQQITDNTTINALYLPSIDEVIETNLINTTNEHYESISKQAFDLSAPGVLAHVTQMTKLHGNSRAIAGLMSTRAYGTAYLYAGTNRAPVAFAMEHFLCKPMESLNDTSISDFRNRRDVDRSPGGTSEIYKNRCVGCHAGMDALAGAFAYYDYANGKVLYNAGKVAPKMNHNVTFNEGFVTMSDSWINLWDQGQNATLKWGPTNSGEGARSFGMLLSETEAFHSCMSKQVYEKVCARKATSDQDKARIFSLTETYKGSNFNMKNLFINAAVMCMED